MSAFTTAKLSPFELNLDIKNPRFIIPLEGATEEDIFLHLLRNEHVDKFCNRLNNVGTILPGERIVACMENNEYIVLEGNRRVCCCKMLLDRSLIPEEYKRSIKEITEEARANLSVLDVDIVTSREAAKKYLAARHIAGVQDWATIAKMNYVREEFLAGKSIESIMETTSLTQPVIKKYLKDANLLEYAIDNGNWTDTEKAQLRYTDIEPDRYLRLFHGGGLNGILRIYFDPISFAPHSSLISDTGLYLALAAFVKMALIDRTVDTRTPKEKIVELAEPYLRNYSLRTNDDGNKGSSDVDSCGNDGAKDHQADGSEDRTKDHQADGSEDRTKDHQADGSEDRTKDHQEYPKEGHGTGNKPNPPRSAALFASLDCSNLDRSTCPDYRGLIFITREIIRFSSVPTNPNKYPIAATLLTRSLLENTIVAFIKKNGDWEGLLKGNNKNANNIKLSKMIDLCCKKNTDYFSDPDVRKRFMLLFENYETGNKLNWVVHQLSAYLMTGQTLQSLVDEGLFDVIQYMIKQL